MVPPVETLPGPGGLPAGVAPAAVAARADVSTAAWERRAALADLFTPNVSAATGYTSYDGPFFSFTGPANTTSATAELRASYTLLGTGKVSELRRSNASVATADAMATAARFRIALATDAAYYAVLAESELSRVAADRLRRAQEQLGVSRVRVQAGDGMATGTLQLVLELNRARLDVLRSDSALMVSRLRLGRQIGLARPATAAP